MQENSVRVIVAKNIKTYLDTQVGEEYILGRLNSLRSLIRMEKGFPPPRVSLSIAESLQPCNYLIKLNDKTVDFGQAPADRVMVLGTEEELSPLSGEIQYDSLSGSACKWVSPTSISPEIPGHRILSGIDVITLHLLEMMRLCAHNLFDQAAFLSWKDHPDFARFRGLLSPLFEESNLYETLRALLKMRLSLCARQAICEGLEEGLGEEPGTPSSMAERAREKLLWQLKSELFDTSRPIYLFHPEKTLVERISRLSHSRFPDLLFMDEYQKILYTLGEAIYPVLIEEGTPILIIPPSIRQFMEDATYQIYPEISIFSTGEIDTGEGDALFKRIHSIQPIDDKAGLYSVEVFRWFKGRYEVFKKLRLGNYPFYRLAPIQTGSYWNYILRGEKEMGRESIEMAKRLKPHHYLPHHLSGEQFLRMGSQREAQEEFELASRKSPCYLDALIDRARDVFLEGDIQHSIDLLSMILTVSPENSRGWCNLGEIYKMQGESEEAEKALRKSLSISPENLRARRVLAWVYMDSDEMKEAEVCFREILAIDPKDPLGRYGLGLIYYNSGRTSEAEWEFFQTIQSDPGFHWAYYRLGWLYFKQGKLIAAEQKFIRALELGPENVDFHLALGMVYFELQNFTGSRAHLELALSIEPGNISVRETLARLLSRTGEKIQALDEYRKLLRAFPEEGSYHYESGLLLWEMGDFSGAAASFENALKWSPGLSPAREALGWMLILTKDHGRAEQVFCEGLQCDPDHLPFLYGLGCIYFSTSRSGQAFDAAQRIVKKHPDFEWAYYLISKITHAEGRLDEARLNIRKALAIQPRNPSFICEESSLAIESGDPSAAIASLEALTEGESPSETAFLLLGRAYRLLKKGAQAETQWLKGLSLFPQNGSFYLELFLLYAEESSFKEMEELEPLVHKNIEGTRLGTVLPGLIKLSNLELREAESIFLNTRTAEPQICHSYLGLLYFLQKDYGSSYDYMKLAEKERGEGILRDSYVAELLTIKGKDFSARCSRYVRQNPEDLLVAKNLGEFYLKTGNFSQAAILLRRAFAANPRLPRIHALMAEMHYRRGLFKKAEALLKEGMTLFPANPELKIKLGQLYFDRGMQKQGEVHARQGLMTAPSNLKSFYLMLLEWNRGNFTEAERLYDELADYIQKSHEALMLMSGALLHQKRYDEALIWLNRSMEGLVDRFIQAELYYTIAVIYWLKGMDKEARRNLRQSRKRACGTGNAILSEAFLQYLDNNLKKAEILAARAGRKRPAFAEAYFLLGLIWEKTGDPAASRKMYEKAVKIYPWSTRYRERFEGVNKR